MSQAQRERLVAIGTAPFLQRKENRSTIHPKTLFLDTSLPACTWARQARALFSVIVAKVGIQVFVSRKVWGQVLA